MKRWRNKPERIENPNGETRDEFIERYGRIKEIAAICWYFGVYPEELRDELKILLNESEENWHD